MESLLCKCGNLRRGLNQRYCLDCHAENMRENRPDHCDLSKEAKKKANTRSYANVYQNRGILVKEPCALCGSNHSEKHHEDYDQPLDVEWLCRVCHLEYHRIVSQGTL